MESTSLVTVLFSTGVNKCEIFLKILAASVGLPCPRFSNHVKNFRLGIPVTRRIRPIELHLQYLFLIELHLQYRFLIELHLQYLFLINSMQSLYFGTACLQHLYNVYCIVPALPTMHAETKFD